MDSVINFFLMNEISHCLCVIFNMLKIYLAGRINNTVGTFAENSLHCCDIFMPVICWEYIFCLNVMSYKYPCIKF
jgi:hypothetical protein